MNDVPKERLIRRYNAGQRTNHWLVAISFILLAVSGLALYHPAFFWLSVFLGGPVWTRILHPFIGIFMFVMFAILALRMMRDNFIHANDRAWLRHANDVVMQREDRVPDVGRYNGGQKLLFWVLVLMMLALLVTGVLMWRAYFAFPLPVMRTASMLHALFAVIIICTIIVHIYSGYWVKGSVTAMTRGTVTPGWAWKHHRAWFRQIRDRDDVRDRPVRGTPAQR